MCIISLFSRMIDVYGVAIVRLSDILREMAVLEGCEKVCEMGSALERSAPPGSFMARSKVELCG